MEEDFLYDLDEFEEEENSYNEENFIEFSPKPVNSSMLQNGAVAASVGDVSDRVSFVGESVKLHSGADSGLVGRSNQNNFVGFGSGSVFEKPVENVVENVIVEKSEVIASEDSTIVFDIEPDPEPIEQIDTSEVSLTKRSTDIEYPLLLLETNDMAQHKIIALKSMLTSKHYTDGVTLYSVYLKMQGNIMKIGATTDFSLNAILSSDIFKDFKKAIKLDETTKIEGDLMYALCGFKI